MMMTTTTAEMWMDVGGPGTAGTKTKAQAKGKERMMKKHSGFLWNHEEQKQQQQQQRRT